MNEYLNRISCNEIEPYWIYQAVSDHSPEIKIINALFPAKFTFLSYGRPYKLCNNSSSSIEINSIANQNNF